MLMEEMNYNLLFRWFVGLEMDDEVWDVTVFTENRERLIAGEVAQKFFAAVLKQARGAASISRWMERCSKRGRVGAVLRRSRIRRNGVRERADESCCATRTSRRPTRRRDCSGGARRRNRGRVIWGM